MLSKCENIVRITGSKEEIINLAKAFQRNRFLSTITKEKEGVSWKIKNWGTTSEIDSKNGRINMFQVEEKATLSAHFFSENFPPLKAFDKLLSKNKVDSIVCYYLAPESDLAGKYLNGRNWETSLLKNSKFWSKTPLGIELDAHFEISKVLDLL